MAQISNILQGWKKYINGDTTDEERRRAEICSECEHATVGTYEKLMKDFELKKVQGFKCGKCHCPLSTKIRSKNEKCPAGKWGNNFD